jgi:MFS family permease
MTTATAPTPTAAPPSGAAAGPDPRRWLALALLAVAQFVVVLDASIMNIALPSIGTELHVSTDTLSWVVNAYVLAFGGLLLLGGRLADLLGRRRAEGGLSPEAVVALRVADVGGQTPFEAASRPPPRS